MTVEVGLQWNDSYQESMFCVHEQHPAEGRRHAPGRLPQRPHAHAQQLHREAGLPQEGQDPDDRAMTRAKGLTAILSVKHAGPEVLLADEGQARLVRESRASSSRPSAPSSTSSCSEHPQQAKRRSSAKIVEAARAREAARKAREMTRRKGALDHRGSARQARRLPGARSGAVRDVPRRGRFRRRLGEAGARPAHPGDPAAQGQDPERREGALRQDAVVGGDRHADHRARHAASARTTSTSTKLRYHRDHHHDRRGRRRLAHPHAAADVLLPPDAAS